jgi:rifampicin phosphotransferase
MSHKSPLVCDPVAALRQPASVVGGKAGNMALLSSGPARVPHWIVVTTESFRRHIDQAGVDLNRLATFRDDDGLLEKELTRVRNQIIQSSLPPEVDRAVTKAFGQAFPSPETKSTWAVRSSMVGEDAAAASFAGQLDSFLFQRTLDNIRDSIRRCFASALSYRAVVYRLRAQLPIEETRAAAIIQEMVEGEVSGVLFTANPTTGDRTQAVVSACYGVGEGVVSGECATDEYVVALREGSLVDSTIAEKDEMIVFDHERGYGVKKTEVAVAQRQEACLSELQIRNLSETAWQIAQEMNKPQDIEWAFRGDSVYILQTRPITSLPYPTERKGRRTVWDNSNIEESYCGVNLPMTISFAQMAYSKVYKNTLRATGMPDAQVQEHDYMLRHLVGTIQGRMYYNINHWYEGIALLPSFEANKEDMERMMGLQDPVDFIESEHLSLGQKIAKVPGLLVNIGRLLAKFYRIQPLVEEFQQMFRTVYDGFDRHGLQQLQIPELYAETLRLQRDLLDRWTAPIYNDFYVMMMSGRVRRALEKANVEDSTTLQNRLVAGETGIESTEPTKALLRLTQTFAKNETLRAAIKSDDHENLLRFVKHENPELHERCEAYIERFGDRCIGEQKLETLTLRQDPSFMFEIISNFLDQPDLSCEEFERRERETRREAEAEADRYFTSRFARNRFKKVLNNLRRGIKNRENMRMNRSRMFGMFREIYREMGRQFAFYGVMDDPEDIFYLTLHELETYFDGVCVSRDFKSLVAIRKRESAEHHEQDPPHHFETIGMIYHLTDYKYSGKIEIDPNAEVLNGIGCYPGRVTGEIRLILDPAEEKNLNGRILCTRRTDPGWAPLFPSAGGILVERGSTLSHSAVVARELGIPAVVGVPGLTSILKDGDSVTMDGAAGTIEIHRDGKIVNPTEGASE